MHAMNIVEIFGWRSAMEKTLFFHVRPNEYYHNLADFFFNNMCMLWVKQCFSSHLVHSVTACQSKDFVKLKKKII